jgi:hypothetical protein
MNFKRRKCSDVTFHAWDARPIIAWKGGKTGWNKGWSETRMKVVDLGVNSAIYLCDPRTRLNARAGVTRVCLPLPMQL